MNRNFMAHSFRVTAMIIGILMGLVACDGVSVPTVTTAAGTDITITTASSGGNVSSDGGAQVTGRGVCYGPAANPDISGSHTSDGTGTGAFTSALTGLTQNTTYHVRAYATNSKGTAYGNDQTFTTATLPEVSVPTVTTAAGTDITTTTASSGGNVSSDGGAQVTGRGVCYGPAANPDISGSHTNDGTGTGAFTSALTGLTQNTTYHVRAYATNSQGTAYGNDQTFTTAANPTAAQGSVPILGSITGLSLEAVGADSTGNAIMLYRRTQDATHFTIGAMHYAKATGTWTGHTELGTDVRSSGLLELAVNKNGYALALWGSYNGSSVYYACYNPTTSTWSGKSVIATQTGGLLSLDAKIDDSGNAMATWAIQNAGNRQVFARYYPRVAGSWNTLRNLTPPGWPAAQDPRFAFDASGNGMVVFGKWLWLGAAPPM